MMILAEKWDLKNIKESLMPGAIRPNEKCAKLAYKILNTPKDKQQDNQKKPSPEKIKEWFRDSSSAQ